ncbi:MAG: hypothetical protein AMXMBFR61_27740 [Fimbriimonadales bacterium]
MIRKALLLALATLVAVMMVGCSEQKDYSKTPLQPKGEPNPDLPVASPGGASGGPGGAAATGGEGQ